MLFFASFLRRRRVVAASSLSLAPCCSLVLLLGAVAEFGVSLIVSRVLVHHISLICGLVVEREVDLSEDGGRYA